MSVKQLSKQLEFGKIRYFNNLDVKDAVRKIVSSLADDPDQDVKYHSK